MWELQRPSARYRPRRRKRDPQPRFKHDCSEQLDVVHGCPALSVPPDHLSRQVWRWVQQMDLSALEAHYSSLGRHGYHPRHVLAVWIYASLVGMHHSTKVSRALQTDAAFRLLSGGHAMSSATLRRFRQRHGAFFARAIEWTIGQAAERGMVDIEALAIDSVRIGAHASRSAVRTLKRSKERLKELSEVAVDELTESEGRQHEARLQRHRQALAACKERGRTSVVMTNESAALMKMPHGASAPAHRATVIASGSRSRVVVGVLIDAASTDHGKLGAAVCHTKEVLERLGLRHGRMIATADAGYGWKDDLLFAYQHRDWVDLLVPQRVAGRYHRFFARDRFVVDDDGHATCPAGRSMLGPYPNDRQGKELKWVGVGCPDCPLKPKCTDGKVRGLQIDIEADRARQSMTQRFAQSDAAPRYNQRMATIEPVFSYLESTMGFNRCSSRLASTVHSEILLKILAYNIARLIQYQRSKRKLSFLLLGLDLF